MKPKKSARLDIYARGGDVATTRSKFLKVPDSFRHDTEKTNFKKVGKGGSKTIEKPVKPQAAKQRGARK